MEKILTDLNNLLTDELKKIVDKNDISPAELENATKAVCLMIKTNELLDWPSEEEMNEYYSRRGYSGRDMSYRRGRDSRTGRYISRSDGRSYRRNSYDRGSMEDGYSNHSIKDRMIAGLEHMMDDADGDYEKQQISEWINRLEMDK